MTEVTDALTGDLILVDDKPPLIFAAMAAILAEMPPIAKESGNTGGSGSGGGINYKFRGIDAVQIELSPLCGKHGVFFLPRVIERIPEARKTGAGGTMWVVHLHIEFTFYAADGSSVTADAWGEGTDMGDKATAKAHTGAMKSALLAAFNIATAESARLDPDHDTPDDSVEYIAPPDGWATIEEHDDWRKEVRARGAALGLDLQGEFAAWWKSTGWKWPLTGDQADEYSERLAELEAKAVSLPLDDTSG